MPNTLKKNQRITHHLPCLRRHSLSRTTRFLSLKTRPPRSLSPFRFNSSDSQFQPSHSTPSSLSSPSHIQKLSYHHRQGRQQPSRRQQAPARHLPSSTPATTSHQFRRHHDQKIHLEVLYTTVLTISLFDVLEKLQKYCVSPSCLR